MQKTMIITIFFWISLAVLFYCYLGYGILVLFINTLKGVFAGRKRKHLQPQTLPVTIIITAYNEEAVLEQKIKNTLAIDYPANQFHIIFITDGSSDDPAQLFKRYPSITLLHEPVRKGKYAAIKRAMQKVQTPFVVFSDANTMLNKECISNIIPHYADEKVGAVAGEKKIINNKKKSVAGEAERIYWKYESFMKKLDAGLYTVSGAAGELFSIRTGLFKALDDEVILDDFVISMQVCLQGYKIAYEPEAFATELPSASLAEEEKRKVRISAGAYQSIGYLKDCLNIFKHPLLSFQFISRRLLRWIFCPPLLVVLLLTNILVVFLHTDTYLYSLLLFAQAGFYLLAFSGWIIARSGKKTGILTIPFYFIFMNYCLVKGFVKFIKGRQSVLWEKSLRQAVE
jgi:cellulose synthase/poly-beta-1,6-N-acetylglucosamine synthase-like glycosyltransferase